MTAEYNLSDVFPWGRLLDDYTHMFDLTEDDLALRIVDCGGGPAGFNSEMYGLGRRVVSCDPLYQFTAEDIRARIDEVYEDIIAESRRNQDNYVWSHYKSPDEIAERRMAAMQDFLADYEAGRSTGRYIEASLPNLPLEDGAFDLALCSHLLFTYSHVLDQEFHIAAIREMCRVAREVRIFPLMDFYHKRSEHLVPVVEALTADGLAPEIRRVPYEFQRGGNEMLVVGRS